ncbi:MAG: hypothetical protein ACF8XB_08130 [Planctomycetota bacterium JB042]
MRRGVGLAVVVVAGSLVGCEAPEMNKVREAFGAKAEASEEGKTLGEVSSETAGDAKEGIDEAIEEHQADDGE